MSRGCCRIFGTGTSCTRSVLERGKAARLRQEANYVPGATSGLLATDLGVVATRQTLAVTSYLLALLLLSLFVCQGKGGTEVDKSAGEAKRGIIPNGGPTAREEERDREEVVLICCFVVFVSFF